MTFSFKVRRAREKVGMTQMELARATGVSQRMIAAYEAEGVVPRKSTTEKLAHALKVSKQYLQNPDCLDPLADIDRAEYVEEARALYGPNAERDMEELLQVNRALFAGGELTQEQKDEFFQAIMTAYVIAKEEARKKYGRKEKSAED